MNKHKMESDKNYWNGWMKRRMSRRAMLRQAGLTGLVVAGGSVLWGCGSGEAPKASQSTPAAGSTSAPVATPTPNNAPKRGGTIRIGGDKGLSFSILDPHTFFHGGDEVAQRANFDYLVNYDEKMAYTPGLSLAESWTAVDDVTLQFKLRKGVKFTDGTEWNSKTLKFNIDRIANKDTKSPRAYALNSVKAIEYPDDYTAKIILKEPMASFLGEVAHAGFGMVSPANVAKYELAELQRRPVGTGPFSLTEGVADDHYTFARNKEYWRKDASGGQVPYVDAINFMVIPDATVRLANLRTGVIDVDLYTVAKDVAKIKEEPNLQVVVADGVGIRGMYWNMSRAPFNNINFRRAVKYGIDRETMTKITTFGLSSVWNGIVMPSAGWAWDAKRTGIPYDGVKAKQYLDQAIAQGVKPEFTSFVPSGIYTSIAQMMQSDLSKIGIKMNIRPEETSTSASRYWTTFEIDCFVAGYSMGPDPYSKIFVAHHGKGFYNPEKKELGDKWDTPEGYYAKIDPLIDASNRTYDLKKRAELMYQASDVLDDHVAFVGFFYTSTPIAMSKKLQGFSTGGDGKGRFDTAWFKA